jgi:hypothetical protein
MPLWVLAARINRPRVSASNMTWAAGIGSGVTVFAIKIPPHTYYYNRSIAWSVASDNINYTIRVFIDNSLALLAIIILSQNYC